MTTAQINWAHEARTLLARRCSDAENWIRVRRSAVGNDVDALIELLESGQALLDDIIEQRAKLAPLMA